ncbi:1653_t:CDS:1, partial [Gigaspora margarita]
DSFFNKIISVSDIEDNVAFGSDIDVDELVVISNVDGKLVFVSNVEDNGSLY